MLEKAFPKLKAAFFIFSLKTGTEIIGWLNLIVTAAFCLLLDDGNTVTKYVGQVLDYLHLLNVKAWEEDEIKFHTAQKYISVAVDVTLVFMALSNYFLLRGVQKARPGLIMFWLHVNTVISMMSVAACALRQPWAFIYAVYNVYSFWVVSCYYREVLDMTYPIPDHDSCDMTDHDDLIDVGLIGRIQIRLLLLLKLKSSDEEGVKV